MLLTTSFPPPFTVDTDIATWAAQVVTDGGSVSRYQEFYLSSFFAGLKSASIFSLIDDIGLIAGENTFQALRSLKQLLLTTPHGSPTFTAKRGYSLVGPAYLDTGFNFATNAVQFTGSVGSTGIYTIANNSGSGYASGVAVSATEQIGIIPRNGSNQAAGFILNNDSGNTVGTVTDSRGYTVVSRSAGPVWTIYKNGSSLGTYTPGASTTTLPAFNLFIGARNNSGTADSFRTVSAALWDVRGALTAPQEATYYGLVQQLMTAMGCQV